MRHRRDILNRSADSPRSVWSGLRFGWAGSAANVALLCARPDERSRQIRHYRVGYSLASQDGTYVCGCERDWNPGSGVSERSGGDTVKASDASILTLRHGETVPGIGETFDSKRSTTQKESFAIEGAGLSAESEDCVAAETQRTAKCFCASAKQDP